MNYPVNTIYNYEVQTVIAPRPITAADMIQHLKLDDSLLLDADFVAYMESLIDAAIAYCENVTGRTIRQSTFEAVLDSFCTRTNYYYDEFEIRVSPLASVDLVQYYKEDVLTTIADTVYQVPLKKDYSTILPKFDQDWPTDYDTRRQAIVFGVTGGYPEDGVPADLLLALKNHVGALFSHRGDCDNGNGRVGQGTGNTCGLPGNVKNTYRLYKILDIRIGY
jgi:hypothetical protein